MTCCCQDERTLLTGLDIINNVSNDFLILQDQQSCLDRSSARSSLWTSQELLGESFSEPPSKGQRSRSCGYLRTKDSGQVHL